MSEVRHCQRATSHPVLSFRQVDNRSSTQPVAVTASTPSTLARMLP